MWGCVCGWAEYPGANAYIAARDAENKGRYADAVSGYEACAQKDTALAEFARVRAAVCRARGGDTSGAMEHLQALAMGAKAPGCALLARAELAVLAHRAGQYAEAVKLLAPIAEAPIHPKWLDPYLRIYGDSLIALPDAAAREKGYALFAEMLAEARTRAQRLEAADRLAGSPAPKQRLDALTTFASAGEWGKAASALNSLESLPNLDRAKNQVPLDYFRARGQLANGPDREAGRMALLAVAKAHSDNEFGRLALMHAARSYFTAGQEPRTPNKKEKPEVIAQRKTCRETAAKLFDLMANDLPDTSETGDALWWLSLQHFDRKDDPKERDAALAEFQRMAATCPNHPRAADALFRAALILRDKGDASSSVALLKQIIARYPAEDVVPAAAYDCGRACLAQGDRVNAAAMFAKAVETGGLGNFYAHRAGQRLAELDVDGSGAGTAISAPGISEYLRALTLDADKPKAKPKAPWLERMRFFAGHGYEEAEWEVLAHLRDILGSENTGGYLAVIADAGLAATVNRIIEKTNWGMKNKRPTEEVLPALYPRAYWGEVQTTARETGADPLLLLAIARQESLFQARIESHAGATGVMQVMPSTAAWLTKTDSSVGAEHLLTLDKPASSLRLGGYYYRYILGKQGGNTVFAIASYNAGPGNVSKWRARYDSADLDNFIEAIPFDETRDFVKKVLGNYAAYHSIYPDLKRLAESDYDTVESQVAQ